MNKDERFIRSKGWKKIRGYKVDLELFRDLPDHIDIFYISKEDIGDYLEKCTFWQHDDWEEEAFPDVDAVLEFLEVKDDEL